MYILNVHKGIIYVPAVITNKPYRSGEGVLLVLLHVDEKFHVILKGAQLHRHAQVFSSRERAISVTVYNVLSL